MEGEEGGVGGVVEEEDVMGMGLGYGSVKSFVWWA